MRKSTVNGWRQWALLSALLAALLPAAVQAADKTADPYAMVRKVTAELVSAAQQQSKGGAQKDFNSQVNQALEPVVAFDYIARVVMGDTYKSASPEQRKAFAKKFKTGLITTYAKGIATYADSDIKTLPPAQPLGDSRRVAVEQKVQHDGATHKLSYTMGKNRQGQWKLINLVLNGVNLGQSLRSQFQQLANKYHGDIDKITAHWDVDAAQ